MKIKNLPAISEVVAIYNLHKQATYRGCAAARLTLNTNWPAFSE